MANDKKKKNPKRLECLKKKIKELSILCDVEALFLCKEDDPSSNSFVSWPEDRNSCLSLIDKYKRSSVLAKSCNKKTNAVPRSTVLGKRKEGSDADAQMELNQNAQKSKKFHMGFVDGVDFDDFYGKFLESVQETQKVLCNNVKENDKFELGLFDGVPFDENFGSFCELIQENEDLGKTVEESEKHHMVLCQNGQEIENLQIRFVDGVEFHDFYSKFCESVEENPDLVENVQKIEGFFDGLDCDEVCSNFWESMQENRNLSYTQMLLCENVQETEGFQMGFVDGRDSDELDSNFCESIPDLDKKFQESEKFEMANVDGIVNKLGRGDLIEILNWINYAFRHL